MKKSILGLAALALLASCNNDEELNSLAPEAITFGNPFVDNATRAIDPSYGDGAVHLTQFNVWGAVKGKNAQSQDVWVPIFANDAVTGAVGSDVWTLGQGVQQQYWIANSEYHFAAVVNGGADSNFGTLTNGLPTQVSFTSNDATDLLYAYAERNTASGTGPVNFSFDHMLAKAVVTVSNSTNTNATDANGNYVQSGYFYRVKNVQLAKVVKSGTCEFSTKAWSSTGAEKSVVFGNITNAAQSATNSEAIKIEDQASKLTSHNARMIIPQTITKENFAVSFTLELYMMNGTEEVLISTEQKTVKPTDDVTFVAGHSYSFDITVGVGSPIQFTVEKKPTWTGGSVDVK